MGVSLSGFLPGDNNEGVSRLAESLVAAFEEEYSRGDDVKVEAVVVGVTYVKTVKHHADHEKAPTPELWFSAIEVVEGSEADQVRKMVARAKGARTKLEPLRSPSGVSVDDLPDINNVAEPDRPAKKAPGKKAPGKPSKPRRLRAVDPEDGEGKK